MKRTYKRKLNLNEPSFGLNKYSYGCAPCLKEALEIKRKVKNRLMRLK